MSSKNRVQAFFSDRRIVPILSVLATALILYSLYLVFVWAPIEKFMGPVQRIFYFHVGSALAAYTAIAFLLLGCVAYLATRERCWDALAVAGGEVGFLFCSIVLFSGMIWGHSAWQTWFNWEPRLVSFLLLWLIFLAYNLLRIYGEPTKVASHAAVLGIVGAVTVPLMVFSIRLLPQVQQLHPVVIEKQGLAPEMSYTLLWTLGALFVVQLLFIVIRTQLELLSQTLEDCYE